MSGRERLSRLIAASAIAGATVVLVLMRFTHAGAGADTPTATALPVFLPALDFAPTLPVSALPAHRHAFANTPSSTPSFDAVATTPDWINF